MEWPDPDKGRTPWIHEKESDAFFKRLVGLKATLHIVKNPHSCFFWFLSGSFFSTTVNFESPVYKLLADKFPPKMRKILSCEDDNRWQTLSWGEIKDLHF